MRAGGADKELELSDFSSGQAIAIADDQMIGNGSPSRGRKASKESAVYGVVPPVTGMARDDDDDIDLHVVSSHPKAAAGGGGCCSCCSRCGSVMGSAPEGEGADYSLAKYLATSTCGVLKQRLPWLVTLLILQSFSAAIMHGFHTVLEEHIVVAFFVPMLVGTGGNAGNQPGVMVTRALGNGELKAPGVLRKVVAKESRVSVTIATILGTISFLRVEVEYPGEHLSALTIAIAMWFVVFLAVFLGVGFSVLLDRLGLDPAAGAAPTLSTIADITGITVLCASALLILGKTAPEATV